MKYKKRLGRNTFFVRIERAPSPRNPGLTGRLWDRFLKSSDSHPFRNFSSLCARRKDYQEVRITIEA